MLLTIRTDFWPLFYTDRLKACALVGVRAFDLGPAQAANEPESQHRREPILVTRVAYTIWAEILPEDLPLCGYLSVASFEQNLQLQRPGMTPVDPVTIIYFRRHRESS